VISELTEGDKALLPILVLTYYNKLGFQRHILVFTYHILETKNKDQGLEKN